MKALRIFVLLTIGLLGLLGGYAGHRMLNSRAKVPPDPVAGEKVSAHAERPAARVMVRSTDTARSMASASGSGLCGRLAAWLADASEADIAAYCEASTDMPPDDMLRLIFLRWTRFNPQAALATAKDIDKEGLAWWAWGCNDPKEALAAALAPKNRIGLQEVARAVGECQMTWLMEHFDEIPPGLMPFVFSGMGTWDNPEHPLELLNFFKRRGMPLWSTHLAALARRDPWGALEWFTQNKESFARSPLGLGTES